MNKLGAAGGDFKCANRIKFDLEFS
jgi:hypothetical protein